MNKNNPPSEFNLFHASDAMLGMFEAMHEMMMDVPETEPERTRWLNALNGLAWSGRNVARETNAFLAAAGDKHRFPARYSDIESDWCVREPAPVYNLR